MERPNIFDYIDYRDFLRDMYHFLKISTKGAFSYRVFAKKAQMGSPNYLKLVMDGQRELSNKTINRFCKALSLNKEEGNFFQELVFFCKSSSDEERQHFFNRLKKFKKFKLLQNIQVNQHDYFSKWYIPVIREMVLLKGFKGDPAWIAKHVEPPITEREAAHALEVLIKLGFLVKGDRGKLVQNEPTLATSTDEVSEQLWNYHREMLYKAQYALRQPNEERNIASMTLSVSKEQFQEIKKKVDQFYVQINDYITETPEEPEVVCVVNFQQFKVSRGNS